jgi:hypothetical protein
MRFNYNHIYWSYVWKLFNIDFFESPISSTSLNNNNNNFLASIGLIFGSSALIFSLIMDLRIFLILQKKQEIPQKQFLELYYYP